MVNVSDFLELQTLFQLDACQALCDSDTPDDASKKRINHSVTRTLQYLDDILENGQLSKSSCLFATVEGGHDLKQRETSARETASREVSGFVVDGFHLYGPTSFSMDIARIDPCLSAAVNELPKSKPRAVFGAFSLDVIKRLIGYGIDIFDTSYACHLTEQGMALCVAGDTLEDSQIVITEAKYKDDHTVIDTNCACYTCQQKFTKAYVHHLIDTHEMLASTLLMIHNLHNFIRWFELVRRELAANKA